MRRNAFGIFMAVLTSAVLLKLAQGPSKSAEPQAITDPGLMALDALNGFRDVQFGTPPAHNMDFVGAFNGEENYRRSERLHLGDIKLAKITYTFWRGKLSIVTIKTASSDTSALRDALRASYGPGRSLPDDSQKGVERHEWRGNVVLMDIHRSDRNVYCTMTSLPIELEKKTYEAGLMTGS